MVVDHVVESRPVDARLQRSMRACAQSSYAHLVQGVQRPLAVHLAGCQRARLFIGVWLARLLVDLPAHFIHALGDITVDLAFVAQQGVLQQEHCRIARRFLQRFRNAGAHHRAHERMLGRVDSFQRPLHAQHFRSEFQTAHHGRQQLCVVPVLAFLGVLLVGQLHRVRRLENQAHRMGSCASRRKARNIGEQSAEGCADVRIAGLDQHVKGGGRNALHDRIVLGGLPDVVLHGLLRDLRRVADGKGIVVRVLSQHLAHHAGCGPERQRSNIKQTSGNLRTYVLAGLLLDVPLPFARPGAQDIVLDTVKVFLRILRTVFSAVVKIVPGGPLDRRHIQIPTVVVQFVGIPPGFRIVAVDDLIQFEDFLVNIVLCLISAVLLEVLIVEYACVLPGFDLLVQLLQSVLDVSVVRVLPQRCLQDALFFCQALHGAAVILACREALPVVHQVLNLADNVLHFAAVVALPDPVAHAVREVLHAGLLSLHGVHQRMILFVRAAGVVRVIPIHPCGFGCRYCIRVNAKPFQFLCQYGIHGVPQRVLVLDRGKARAKSVVSTNLAPLVPVFSV